MVTNWVSVPFTKEQCEQYEQAIQACYEAAATLESLPAEKPGNVIVFGFRDPPAAARWDELERKACDLEARYALEFGKFVHGLRRMNRCDAERLYILDGSGHKQ